MAENINNIEQLELTKEEYTKKDLSELNKEILSSLKSAEFTGLNNEYLEAFKNIDYKYIDVNIIKEGRKAFTSKNENTILTDLKNIHIYGSEKNTDLSELYKENINDYVKRIYNDKPEIIYVYRNGLVFELKNIEGNYLRENEKDLKIYFGDIISDNKDNFKSFINKNYLEQKLGFINIYNIKKFENNFIIEFSTEINSEKHRIIYLENKNFYLINEQGEIIKKDLFLKENIAFKEKFDQTAKYFEGINMFDEPVNEKVLEDGKKEQLDGTLRPIAINEIKKGNKESFSFRGVDYPIYVNGKLNIPQVCIDYIFDFKEKFNDSYFDNEGNHPDKLNFENILGVYGRRRINFFIEQLKTNDSKIKEHFDYEKIEKRVKYNDGEKLKEFIKNDLSQKVNIGDILIISGLISDGKIHNHSVIVSGKKVNGDIFVLENPAIPAENNLIYTLSRGPERSIRYIIKDKKID